MKNWNLQGIICFCGLFTWICRLWLMIQVWWKFKTFTLFPSLPTSLKVNCCCCCIFSRELGWKCRRVNFLLNMGAHHCLDSLPVIRFMHSSVHVLDSWGDQLISRVCGWSCSSWAGWAVPGSKQQCRAGSQQRLQRQAQRCLKYKQCYGNGHMQLGVKVQAILWKCTRAIRC